MVHHLSEAEEALARVDFSRIEGRISAMQGLSMVANLPGARIGDTVSLPRSDGAMGEVVAFEGERIRLLAYDSVSGVGPGDPVVRVGGPLSIPASEALLGRVLDGLGRPIDDGPPLPEASPWPVMRAAPHPLCRNKVHSALPVGVRAIDGLLTLGVGQRVGLFAGSGVGKSTLLAGMARDAPVDVVVLALVGERGREVRPTLERIGERASRTVVVCATSDAPALVRMRSAWVATAVAEYFRDRGRSVLLAVDSLTRFARAAREAGLSVGEAPVRRGFPASVFDALPRLLERAGPGATGAITAVYSVLVEHEGEFDPLGDELRGILDGHIVLDRGLFERGRRPAIDPLRSLSRVMPDVTDAEHRRLADAMRRHLGRLESKRDWIALGAYRRGNDRALDEALARREALEAFLAQPQKGGPCPMEETLEAMRRIVSDPASG